MEGGGVRVYIGERDPDTAQTRVWVAQEVPRPDLAEVVDVIGELRSLSSVIHADDDPEQARRRRAEVLRRKDALVAQLEALERAPRVSELNARVDPDDGYGWGGQAGSANLAFAILRAELGEDPTPPVYLKFRADLLDPVYDRYEFRLLANTVWSWVEENRRLVEVELFEKLPPPAPEAATDLPALSPAADEAPAPSEPISEAAASQVVRACEEAWEAIRTHHPDLPDAVMILGSGVERGRLVKLGHWWAGRWVADGQPRGEVLLAGEALHLKPEEVFEVLLHEAAHGLNAARGVKDTSREGRYHNARFGAAAREVGLHVAAMPPYGVARTSLTDETRERYGPSIDRLGEVMRIARHIERGVRGGGEQGREQEGATADQEEQRSKGRALAMCGCGRKLRVAPTVLAAGPIVCGICEKEFSAGAERTSAGVSHQAGAGLARAALESSFLTRRRAALAAETARAAPAGRTSEQLIADAAIATGAHPADIAAATRWYERFGTADEEPMRAATDDEARRRVQLARALLRADGTLRGPSLDLDGTELASGDRVIVTGDVPRIDLPEGALGTVLEVHGDRADLDFATWGRLRAGIGETVSQLLRHDYVASAAEQRSAEMEPEANTRETDISTAGFER
jgi:hypothetical protein